MGAFNDLFAPRSRDIPQISVIETVVHYANTPLTAREIIEMSEVSRRAVYQILQRYVDDGVIIEYAPKDGERGRRFGLNENDVRARTLRVLEPLLAIGQLESELKDGDSIPQKEMLPFSLLRDEPESSTDEEDIQGSGREDSPDP